MKLILAIISNEDSNKVLKGLIQEKFFVTKLSSTGGFLKTGNTTFLIGASNECVSKVIEIITELSKSRKTIVPNSLIRDYGTYTSDSVEISIGGGTIFVLNVEDFKKV